MGLSADRVQQYENGYRKPKMDKLKEIASALGVETMAFTDPEVTNGIGAMYAFLRWSGFTALMLWRWPEDTL